MKKTFVKKQDSKSLKSTQKFYIAEYKDCNGETIHTQDIGLTTFEVAQEFAAINCPFDRFIETFDIVPVEPDIDCKQLPVNMGFPNKMEGVTLNQTTGQYVEDKGHIFCSDKKPKKSKIRSIHTGGLGLSVGFPAYKQY